MGTKLVSFNVEVEIEKDLYYSILDVGSRMNNLVFMALFAGSVAEPNYQQSVIFCGLAE